MIERVKEFFSRFQGTVFVIGMALFSVFCLYVGFVYLQEFSVFAVVLAMFTTVLVIGMAVDRFILKDFNTLEEIKDGNVAVAGTLIALAILFLAVVSFV